MRGFRRVQMQSWGAPGIPGQTGALLQTFPNRARDNSRLFTGFFEFSGPFVIYGGSLTEGVDAPFLPHRITLDENSLPKRARRRADRQRLLASLEGYGLNPLFLLLTPADPFPLSVLNYQDLPESYGQKKYNSRLAAGLGSINYPPVFAAIPPATSYTMDSCQLLEEIQFHLLLEPDHGITWDLWTQEEVLSRVNERIAHFLGQTWLLTEVKEAPVLAATYSLPAMIDLIRVGWNGLPLQPVDQFQADALYPGWDSNAGLPVAYIEDPQEAGKITFVPTPLNQGTLQLLYVPVPSPVVAACAPMPLPDLFCWAVKWGVISDLLSKQGEASDPERAAYSQQRYEEGISLARLLMGESE